MRLFLSACSRRVRDSSRAFWFALHLRCCNKIVLSNRLCSILFLKFGLDISESLLNKLDVLLALCISSIGMFKSNSKIQNISLKLLFHSKSLHFAFSLCFQSHLHSLKCLGKVFLS